LLEEFEAEGKSHAAGSPEHEGFFAKVKEFFEGKS
jgi:molecular chaperone DnaJ